jgi:hypothetical protein
MCVLGMAARHEQQLATVDHHLLTASSRTQHVVVQFAGLAVPHVCLKRLAALAIRFVNRLFL